jgi:hypothetical protein
MARKKKLTAPAGTSKWVVDQARALKRRGYSRDAAVEALAEWLKSNKGSERDEAGDSFLRTYVDVAYGIKEKHHGTDRPLP